MDPASSPTGEAAAYWKGLFATLLAGAHGQQAALPIVCYPRHSAAFNRYVDRFQREAYADGLRQVGPVRGARALDVGCGIGRWLRVLAAAGAEVTGLDVSPDAIEFCRRHVPQAQLVCSPLTEFTWSGPPFDVLSCVTVLQHVPWRDQPGIVTRLARHVRPGGHALFIELVRTGSEQRAFYEGTGSYANTPAEWRAMLRAAGLTVTHEQPVLFFPIVNHVHLPLKRGVGRLLKRVGVLRHGSRGTLPGPEAPASLIARIEARVDYWLLAATTPVSHLVERLLLRCPEQGLARVGIAASHRLFVARRD